MRENRLVGTGRVDTIVLADLVNKSVKFQKSMRWMRPATGGLPKVVLGVRGIDFERKPSRICLGGVKMRSMDSICEGNASRFR